MLVQLQHQNIKTGETGFVAQKDIDSNDEMQKFFDDVSARHKLPEGHQWLACNENAPEFKRMKAR